MRRLDPEATTRQARTETTRRVRTEAPVVLGRYRLRRRLGTGGFATVWLAHDERLDREVAVKILPRDGVVGGRFEREARAAARLAHPGIVTLYEAAVDDEGAYLVSELVRGTTLDALLADGRLSDRDMVQIGIALCDALAHAHAHGVVHRDVKPSNVLVPDHPTTPSQLARLTDFGVARVHGGDSLTRPGDVIGTAAYMAPEQAQGLPAGASADLFSLALVLYEGLSGVNPVRRTRQRPRGEPGCTCRRCAASAGTSLASLGGPSTLRCARARASAGRSTSSGPRWSRRSEKWVTNPGSWRIRGRHERSDGKGRRVTSAWRRRRTSRGVPGGESAGCGSSSPGP